MSLYHDFILVSAVEHSPVDYSHALNHESAIRLHDDLLRYIGNSLRWIPTINPAKSCEPGRGLNFYGPTAILADGASIAQHVFRGWAQLFRLGPEELLLTGSWTEMEGESNSGRYAELMFLRDEIVTALQRIADACQQARDSTGAKYVLHFGI